MSEPRRFAVMGAIAATIGAGALALLFGLPAMQIIVWMVLIALLGWLCVVLLAQARAHPNPERSSSADDTFIVATIANDVASLSQSDGGHDPGGGFDGGHSGH